MKKRFKGDMCYKIVVRGKDMQTKSLLKKGFAVGIIVVLVGMSIIPIARSLLVDKEQSVMSKSCFYGINISGIIGENGWYVSNVFVSCDFPVDHAYFKFNDGPWQDWFGSPIVVNVDGLYNVSAYYVDNEGHQSSMYYATFKMDKTAPSGSFIGKRVGFFKWHFIANFHDPTSGINRVDFIIDNNFIEFTTPPYEAYWSGLMFLVYLKFVWTGDWEIPPHFIPYDNAGNSPMQPSKASISS
jgi:hypothetical protein